MTDVSAKVWAGRYSGPDGAVTQFDNEWRLMSEAERRRMLVARASIYYSSATNCLKFVKNGRFTLVFRGLAHLFTARKMASRALARTDLTADECDVIQSVFRLTSRLPFFGHDLNYAARAIARSYSLKKELSTEALLAIGQLDVVLRSGLVDEDGINVQYERAIIAYEKVLKALNAAELPAIVDGSVSKETIQLGRQASRIARHLSDFADKLGRRECAHQLRESAYLFACQFGSQDQRHKAS
jgi:hypothetical protein